ncbi:hypothetical protein D9613_010814 [Agrocybe pediades]|uniref:Uncharacterized protein n=1 Tax=Agrocybe pediades TaxID=84607 RepID=A0A8H4QL05_9AGAR|nr:hypothetical protein D9613_010814 [Agrocybe pediades]
MLRPIAIHPFADHDPPNSSLFHVSHWPDTPILSPFTANADVKSFMEEIGVGYSLHAPWHSAKSSTVINSTAADSLSRARGTAADHSSPWHKH